MTVALIKVLGLFRFLFPSALKAGCQLLCPDLAVCCLERWKIKHQRVLRLTLLASTLLPINFVLKLEWRNLSNCGHYSELKITIEVQNENKNNYFEKKVLVSMETAAILDLF